MVSNADDAWGASDSNASAARAAVAVSTAVRAAACTHIQRPSCGPERPDFLLSCCAAVMAALLYHAGAFPSAEFYWHGRTNGRVRTLRHRCVRSRWHPLCGTRQRGKLCTTRFVGNTLSSARALMRSAKPHCAHGCGQEGQMARAGICNHCARLSAGRTGQTATGRPGKEGSLTHSVRPPSTATASRLLCTIPTTISDARQPAAVTPHLLCSFLSGVLCMCVAMRHECKALEVRAVIRTFTPVLDVDIPFIVRGSEMLSTR